MLLLKYNLVEGVKWRKLISFSSYPHYAYNGTVTCNGNVILCGEVGDNSVSPKLIRPLIVKVDTSGNVIWQKKYGSSVISNLGANAIINTQDGGYAFVGSLGTVKVHRTDYWVPWLVKIDSVGTVQWEGIINKQDSDIVSSTYYDLVELTDGAIVVCGERNVYDANRNENRFRGVINKWTANGELVWTNYYAHPEEGESQNTSNLLYDIEITSDSGFVASGYLAFSKDTTQDAWVLKVDSLGCEQPCAVSAISTPVVNEAAWQVYPNPANKFVQVQFSGAQLPEATFTLYNLSGQQVLQTRVNALQQQVSIGHLSPGMYMYAIGNQTGKLVVR